MFGPSLNRIVLSMGMPLSLSMREYIRLARTKISNRIKPVEINTQKAALNENVVLGSDIDLTKFPGRKFWHLDGGRYIGTGDVVITKDPNAVFFEYRDISDHAI
jgi:4-hydroxy-3-polyprenylbenzoate decarboxylase